MISYMCHQTNYHSFFQDKDKDKDEDKREDEDKKRRRQKRQKTKKRQKKTKDEDKDEKNKDNKRERERDKNTTQKGKMTNAKTSVAQLGLTLHHAEVPSWTHALYVIPLYTKGKIQGSPCCVTCVVPSPSTTATSRAATNNRRRGHVHFHDNGSKKVRQTAICDKM
jgi:hypothetical protein